MTYFNAFYEPDGGTLDDGEHHLGRTSLFDAGLDAMIYDLKRTCVCGPGGQQDSLWDHTTVVVVPDNTYLLPKSKNSSGVDAISENANRVPIIVHEPALQGAPFVMSDQDQFASQWDVLPTVLDYTNAYREQGKTAYADELNRYPLAHDLRQQASGGVVNGQFQGVELVRDVAYGAVSETGIAETQAENQPRYLMPRAGKIGVCYEFGVPFCLLDDPGCPCVPIKQCMNKRSATGGWGNFVFCNNDDGCGTCNATSHLCENGLPDFNGKPCSSGRDCVPIGVCRPPLVKIVQTGLIDSPTTKVYEVNTDPDENDDLNSPTPVLGGNLLAQATSCLKEFWKLSPATDTGSWQPVSAGCPASLREWRTCTADVEPTPANCSP